MDPVLRLALGKIWFSVRLYEQFNMKLAEIRLRIRHIMPAVLPTLKALAASDPCRQKCCTCVATELQHAAKAPRGSSPTQAPPPGLSLLTHCHRQGRSQGAVCHSLGSPVHMEKISWLRQHMRPPRSELLAKVAHKARRQFPRRAAWPSS